MSALVLLAPDYKQLYKEGAELFKAKEFRKAANKFEDAYAMKAHWQIAYYAAYSFYKLGNDTKCKFYTEAALSSTPRPSGEYLENLEFFESRVSGYFSTTVTESLDYSLSVGNAQSKDVLKNFKKEVKKERRDEGTQARIEQLENTGGFNSETVPRDFFGYDSVFSLPDSTLTQAGRVTFPIDTLKID